MDQPTELYGRGNLSRHLTHIVRAQYVPDVLPLGGGQGTVQREPGLQVDFPAPTGYSAFLVLDHQSSVRFIGVAAREGGSLPVADDRTVPGLKDVPVNVFYDGRNAVAVEPAEALIKDLGRTYAAKARQGAATVGRHVGKVVARGLRELVDLLDDKG